MASTARPAAPVTFASPPASGPSHRGPILPLSAGTKGHLSRLGGAAPASHLGLLADQTAGSQELPCPEVPLLEAKPLSGAGPEVRRARQQLTPGQSPCSQLTAGTRHIYFPVGLLILPENLEVTLPVSCGG